MSTLLHHIHPWMHKSIPKVEDRIEKKAAQQTELKIHAVHHLLDAFKLRVLAHPAPTIDWTTLQDAMESLQEDMDNIMEIRGPEPEASLLETTEDTMLAALFTTLIVPPPYPRECAKRHHSIRILEGDKARARKKKRTDL